jgi:hypothetical protein
MSLTTMTGRQNILTGHLYFCAEFSIFPAFSNPTFKRLGAVQGGRMNGVG